MNLFWGITLTLVSSIAFIGQFITVFWTKTAAVLGLSESQADVHAVFYADVRGEALWDTGILWILPAAGILLVLNHPFWPIPGLIGGGIYVYFAGRGIVTRREMQMQVIRIGTKENLRMIYLFLAIWGLSALITVVMAISALMPV
ncbi:MAG: hypothetical protein JEZ06_09110 [Anaerolineaceae bacterium]|nr:hypothetical protein [Anaerolineaceae bacterium]